MNRRFVSPFASIESRSQAEAMQGHSVIAFFVWAAALALLSAAVLAGMGQEPEASRGATAGFGFFMAVVSLALGVIQWRKPNRILSSFGVAWSLYELSSLSVGLIVGAPMAMGGLPTQIAMVTAVVLLICASLHAGALRGVFYLARSA